MPSVVFLHGFAVGCLRCIGAQPPSIHVLDQHIIPDLVLHLNLFSISSPPQPQPQSNLLTMDSLPPMPAEITRLITIAMVRVRTVARALRLGLVNRSWNREITPAIIESGIVDCHSLVETSCLWPSLLMHKLQSGRNLPSRPLRMIYRVAQRVVAFCTSKPAEHLENNDDAVRDYLWEICQLSPEMCGTYNKPRYAFWFSHDQYRFHDTEDDFQATLIAAAAATNDLALV